MIKQQYVSGTFVFLIKSYPESYRKIMRSESRVNNISRLIDKRDETANITDFKKALSEMYELNLKGIQLFKDHLEGDSAENKEE